MDVTGLPEFDFGIYSTGFVEGAINLAGLQSVQFCFLG